MLWRARIQTPASVLILADDNRPAY